MTRVSVAAGRNALVGVAAFLLLTGGSLAVAPAAMADHCGAGATATPTRGVVGTWFELDPNLGGITAAELFHNGTHVRSATLSENASLVMRAAAGDVGHWRADFALVSAPKCVSSVEFVVLDSPDTATRPDPARGTSGMTWMPWLIAAGLVAGGLVLRLAGRRQPSRRRAR